MLLSSPTLPGHGYAVSRSIARLDTVGLARPISSA